MFDQAKADRVLKFLAGLRHTKGHWRGVPFVLLPWQRQLLSDVFGTVKDGGFRQYKTAYLEVGKKSGKSELAAGVGLYMLCADGEQSAEVYSCAADRQQASIVFNLAVAMVEMCPALRSRIKPILSQKRLVYMPTGSFYQVLSAEHVSKHGFNVSAVIFDELHAQTSRGLYDVMTQGAGDARKQPLTVVITTAGNDPDRKSIGWEVHQAAEAVLLGTKKDPTLYATIYGLDRENKRIWTGRTYEKPKTDWSDDEVWRKAWGDKKIWAKVNPSLGHTVTLETVQEHYKSASGNVALERNFRWLRLNCWESIKLDHWLGVDFWDLCRERIDEARLHGRPCYGGLDLSTRIDMTAFVLLFPPDDINKKWIVLPRFWVPEDCVQARYHSDKVPYPDWVKQGCLKTTPGNAVDYDFVEREILALRDRFKILEIGYDPWNAMQTTINLQNQGLTMVESRPGPKTMSPPMKEIERLVRSKQIIHSGHPILRWNIGNVRTKSDENENIRPVKDKSTERIDGVVALINAMDRALRHVPASDVGVAWL